ncbi:MAG: ATP synthase epsilon chain [Micavibrio sp.]|nr:MAG: ATP synthase epsilon chain [Micavibrio sp.]
MTEQSTIDFELVSPERKLVSEPVNMVVIPGSEGEMGVGSGHSSVLSSLNPGVIALYTNDNEEPRKIFVAGGFADVTAEICTVLAEEAILLEDLNQSEIDQELKDLNEDLGMAAEESDKAKIEDRITITKAKRRAVTGEAIF